MTAALEVRGLHAGYHRVPVVRGLSFSVEAGSILAVIGANGAGKSTTLNAVAGLLPAIAGEIRLFGRDLTGRPASVRAREGLCLVPQDRGIVRRLTVADNLRMLPGPRNAGVAAAADLFPSLAPLMSRTAGLLSGGEQQILALARALTLRPRVLLIDEMSAGLAPQVVERLLAAVSNTTHCHGTAAVLVEQHAEMALGIADWALVLRHGQQAVLGTAAHVLEHPEMLESTYLGGASDAPTE